MPNFRHVVLLAYRDILQREADAAGLEHYQAQLDLGLTEAQLREILMRSAEYALRFPDRAPHPEPPPAPEPSIMALHVEGNRFVNAQGYPVHLTGAIICCEDAKANGWPLVGLDVLDLFAAHGLNYTHCRLGPFTVAGEGSARYVGYSTVNDGGLERVDLDEWNPLFWQRCREIARHALHLGIYVEFDLIDRWVRQHGADDLPDIDPWSARNNVQGEEHGGLGIFTRAPDPVHERWIRKAAAELGEFENVLFQTGNEGFKSYSEAWELWVCDIVKAELGAHGFANRLVGSNTHDTHVEAQLDYATRHVPYALRPAAYPLVVNEYGSISAEDVVVNVQRAAAFGTTFAYWRGDHDDATWRATLAAISPKEAPVPSPTPCGAPPMPECSARGSDEEGIWGCCRSVEKQPEWCGQSRFQGTVDAVLDEIVSEWGHDRVYSDEPPEEREQKENAFTAEVARRLRLRGLCATTKAETPGGGADDEVGVKDSNDRSEQHDVIFANGRVRRGGFVAVCRPSRF